MWVLVCRRRLGAASGIVCKLTERMCQHGKEVAIVQEEAAVCRLIEDRRAGSRGVLAVPRTYLGQVPERSRTRE
jgi:hypothetical protein